MHHRVAMLGAVFLTFLAGCNESDVSQPKTVPTPVAQVFDPRNCGTIVGQVEWDGAVPTLPSVVMTANAYHNCLYKKPVTCVPPHQPRVSSGAVEGAVVFLRGVDARKARPWDHAAVRVEFRDRQMILKQGETACQTAFVQRGMTIETVNFDEDYAALRGRGADVFGLPLITPKVAARRLLTKNGIVELTSGAGYYWQHAHLFVDEHPYYVRTNADGRFVLKQVPAGTYVIVCWMPSWIVAHKEIDPETAIIARLQWSAPREQCQQIDVTAAGSHPTQFRWNRQMFE